MIALHPTISDIVDLFILAGIYFGYLRGMWQNLGTRQFLLRTCFYWYIVVVLYVTLMPFTIPLFFRQGSAEPANFILFSDVLYHHAHAYLQLFLNALLFMPFGMLLGWIKPLSIWKIIFFGFLCSFSIECLQYVVADGRIFDVSDMFMNTMGTGLGALLGYSLKKCVQVYRYLHHS